MFCFRLFDVLCSARACCPYRADPRLQLILFTHPYMMVFHKYDIDNCIPHTTWIQMLPNFTRLVILDLKLICTDELLEIVGMSCPLMEEINIVSRVDMYRSPFNAFAFKRNVSDNGLLSVAKMTKLRIICMDPPKNVWSLRVGRCVSQAGIHMLISRLPLLEELRIESCDVGATIISSDSEVGPLKLKKLNCHFSSADTTSKVMRLCPLLTELHVTHLSSSDESQILEQIAASDVTLNRLDLSFFSFTPAMERLLMIKGSNLTHFSLWELKNTITVNSIVTIGKHCPNLVYFWLMTLSNCTIPNYFIHNKKIFSKLKALKVECKNFEINDMLTFFFRCSQNIESLVVKYGDRTNVDNAFLVLLKEGYLKNIHDLWLDCTIEVSKSVIKKVIEQCDKLQSFIVEFQENMTDILDYIRENNLDLKLDCTY